MALDGASLPERDGMDFDVVIVGAGPADFPPLSA